MGKKTWKHVPLEEKERLTSLYQSNQDLTEEAAKLNIKVTSLERQIRFFIEYRRLFLGNVANATKFPGNIGKVYTDQEELSGDDWIIISDIEIPDHSVDMLELALLTGMANGIKKMIIAGDLIATDQAALNSWVKTWRNNEATYEEAVDLTTGVLNEYSRWFEEIYIVEGNHDDRVARTTHGEVHLGMLLKGTQAKYSRYSHLWIETSRGDVKVIHPSNFSQNPVTLAQDLYATSPRKGHMVIGHCHRQQAGWTKDGLYEVHALGYMRNLNYTQYRAQKVTKHAQWNSSFLMLRNGFFRPMPLRSTDWRYELGSMYEVSPIARLEGEEHGFARIDGLYTGRKTQSK